MGLIDTCRTYTGKNSEVLESRAGDTKKAITSGLLEVSLGVKGQACKSDPEEVNANEAYKACKHAAKALRNSMKRLDKHVKSLHTMKRTFSARAKDTDDKDQPKWEAATKDITASLDTLEECQTEAERIASWAEKIEKGPSEGEHPGDYEAQCSTRAKESDEWRKQCDEHLKHAAEKVAEMHSKLMTDPDEWQ